jgi:hypothetical protein
VALFDDRAAALPLVGWKVQARMLWKVKWRVSSSGAAPSPPLLQGSRWDVGPANSEHPSPSTTAARDDDEGDEEEAEAGEEELAAKFWGLARRQPFKNISFTPTRSS